MNPVHEARLKLRGELEAPPALGRKTIGASLPCKRLFGDDVQVLELLEEVGIETEGHEGTAVKLRRPRTRRPAAP